MGIYIKGVEMPGLIHGPITIRIYPTGKCINMGSLWPRDSMPGVTAIPVPEHGRLIESAELYGKAEDIKTKALSVCDKPQSWQFGVFWAIEQIEAVLTNAPAIIPASEEGANV